MTKTFSTLAALFLATSALTSAAEAGGVRLSFGGPLGSFTAHPTHSSGPGGTAKYYSRASRYARADHCDKPARKVAQHRPKVHVAEEAPARRVVHKAPKVEVAEAPAVRKFRKPKVVVEKPQNDAPEVKTAKLVDKDVASDAAPSITVPQSPVAPAIVAPAQVTGTQSSPAERTASLEPAVVPAPAAVAPDAEPQGQTEATTAAATPAPAAAVTTEPVTSEPVKTEAVTAEPVKVEPAKTEPVKKTAKGKGKPEAMVARICRRFSAAIAGLVDVPCE